jgi:hypothetical protein
MPRIFEEFHTVGGTVERVHIRNEPDWTPDTMIDTYFDRCDAASGYKPTRSAPHQEDPRYYAFNLYNTMIDRNVAEAKFKLRYVIENMAHFHKQEMARGIKVGARDSWYRADGRSKGRV